MSGTSNSEVSRRTSVILHSKRGTSCEYMCLVCCLVGQIFRKLYQYLEALNINRQWMLRYQWDFSGKYYPLR